jgi:predicted nucleic acid-binding protein
MRKGDAVLDTSFVAPYILPEATSSKIQQFFREHDDKSCVSAIGAASNSRRCWRVKFASAACPNRRHVTPSLRVGDALHLAIASNRNVGTFYTLDKKLLRAGKLLGLSIATGIH